MKQLRADEPAVVIVEGGGGAHGQAQEDFRMVLEASRRLRSDGGANRRSPDPGR